MEYPDLSNVRCLVTGGSRGLGRGICEAFARGGARVAFTYATRDEHAKQTATLVSQHGEPPLVFRGDVADSSHVDEVVGALVAAWGGIDVLVNNAAMTQILPVALLEESDWDRVMAVNVKGPYLFSRAVLKHMIRARSGHILNIGNFASGRIIEAPIHYAASKAALQGLTESLAREVGRYGIQVNLLAPGLLETGLGRILPEHRVQEYLEQCPAGRLGRVDEVAAMVAFMVSAENTFMTGAKVVLDGGL